jgi:hypothetical protein
MQRLSSALMTVGLVGSAVLVASAQSSERLLMWPPLSVGRITSAGTGIKLSPVEEAVRITDIRVAGHSITAGEAFDADDDWLRTLTFRLKNVSGQPIMGARIGFGLPETKKDDGMVGFSLEYGQGSGAAWTRPEVQAVVKPDEEFELKFTDAQYQNYLHFFAKHGAPLRLSKVWIGITTIKFEDGTIWGSGCLRGSGARNSCTNVAGPNTVFGGEFVSLLLE